MGTAIYSYAEWQDEKLDWHEVGDVFPLDDSDRDWFKKDFGDGPFFARTYSVFGFLADVRNYSGSPVISQPRGLPDDLSSGVRKEWQQYEGHSASWLAVDELAAYDYDQDFLDRRVESRNSRGHFDGAALAEESEGAVRTLREFLGLDFFRDLDILSAIEAPRKRVVFWFDG